MLEVLIPADPLKAPAEQGGLLHNRWHPDLPMVRSEERRVGKEC